MHRLFTKIFLSFFATVLAISGLILATTYRRAPVSLAPPLRAVVEQAARKAAEAFEDGDRETLGAATGVFTPNALLFDARGDAVSEVAPASQDLARAVSSAGGARRTRPRPSHHPGRHRRAGPSRPPGGRTTRGATATRAGDRRAGRRQSVAGSSAVDHRAGRAGHVLPAGAPHHRTAQAVSLRAATQQVAAGRLDAAAGSSLTTRRDEIGALGRDFNRMTEHLRDLDVAERRLLADVRMNCDRRSRG